VKSRDGSRQDGACRRLALKAWHAAAVEDAYLECVVLRISGFCEPVEKGFRSPLPHVAGAYPVVVEF
jgi:hypothetical protein